MLACRHVYGRLGSIAECIRPAYPEAGLQAAPALGAVPHAALPRDLACVRACQQAAQQRLCRPCLRAAHLLSVPGKHSVAVGTALQQGLSRNWHLLSPVLSLVDCNCLQHGLCLLLLADVAVLHDSCSALCSRGELLAHPNGAHPAALYRSTDCAAHACPHCSALLGSQLAQALCHRSAHAGLWILQKRETHLLEAGTCSL